jgi:type I restriction enzyme M protein
MTSSAQILDIGTLEGWLWDAACEIRGPVDAPKFKDYILPLIFLKRLSDVYEDDVAALAERFGSPTVAATLADQDQNLVRFYVPAPARWPAIALKTTGLGEHLTDAV